MFEKTREVIKNKNKVDKALKARRNSELVNLKIKSNFKARLRNELRHISIILQDSDVEAVQVTVPDKMLSLFSTAIYSEDLAGYNVTQADGESNKFLIGKKLIDF